MKNFMNELKSLKMIGKFFILTALVIFATSCEEESIVGPEKNGDIELKKAAIAPGDESIAEIAINNDFNELVEALSYVDMELGTGLVDMFLNGTDQYTVFAPTDMAFENLYDALGVDVDDITDLPPELVLDVLLYHVTEGRRASNSVLPKKHQRKIETLLGVMFYVNPDASIEAIGNTANIIAADISASNGIVHVIDAVILPIE